ncbi:MAG: cellulase family glycosylhydrolase [Mycobacteriales bacterium]
MSRSPALSARRPMTLAAAAAAAGLLTAVAPFAHAGSAKAKGFHVSGSTLLDANDKPFVMRGVNIQNVTSPGATAQALNDIAKAGANTVRMTVTAKVNTDGSDNGSSAKDLTKIIAQCKKVKLICVFVDQDTSGYGESGSSAVTLSQAATYWQSVKSAFAGQEAYTAIDIGELPYGSTMASQWTNEATAAVKAMRAGGFKQTLLLTGPDYGEDVSGVMRTNAAKVFAADALRNTVFSVAMYSNYYNAAKVKAYGDAYIVRKLPLVIGEFSWAYLPWGFWNATSGGADGPDEAAIMAYAQQKGIGWNAYAWTGSSTEKAYDDMVIAGNAAAQTPWYGTVVTGANGLKATSQPASVYQGGR